MNLINSKLNRTVLVALLILLLIFAFYLGRTQATKIDNTKVVELEKSKEDLQNTIKTLSKDAKTIEELGFYFPTPQESKDCITTYPIKIKIEKGEQKYYSKKHKSYTKVKADLCGQSVEIVERVKSISEAN